MGRERARMNAYKNLHAGQMFLIQESTEIAKPFLKWAGGKGQLTDKFTEFFPPELKSGKIKRYVEPFVGGGAVFFEIAQDYTIDEFFISDVNEELIMAYQTIKEDVEVLLEVLGDMERAFLRLDTEKRKNFFYKQRAILNTNLPKINFERFQSLWVERTAQIIFLNRTCYNGLYRVNSKGEFNVPFGNYKNPRICDPDNLRAVSRLLQQTTIRHGDFTACEQIVDKRSFVYFDPPYRPLSRTARFTSYSRHEFNDSEQMRLARFYRLLDSKGARLMLSNSDPKNEDSHDDFFEKLYAGFRIGRVMATRMINCDATKRGPIAELIITNY